MYSHGFWFYHELQDKVGTLPAKHRGDKEDSYIWLGTPNGFFKTKASSYRLELFRQNPHCVSCHRIGSLWALESHHPKEAPHLNLYHVEEGGKTNQEWKGLCQDGLVLMTKDHILPTSKGGTTTWDNLQTLCSICNGKKGNKLPYDLPDRFGHIHYEMQCLNGLPHYAPKSSLI